MTTRLGRVAGCLALAFATARCADKILAPVANAGTAVTVNMGSSVALDGRSSADPQGRSLAYDWSITARPVLSQTSLNDAHIATPSFIPDLDGSYTIDLVVSNGVLSSPASQVIVTARKCSEAAPDVTAAVAAPANPNTGNTVHLSATVHDADNDPACNLNQTFTLLWTAVARPSASIAVLSDPAAVSPTFVPDQTGPYQFSVVATDSTGLRSAPKFLTVTTTDCGNHAPAATIASAPASPVPGSSIQLTPTVTDADNAGTCLLNQGFTYAWALTRPPSSATALLSSPAATTPSFIPDVPGTYRTTLTVKDSLGLSSEVAVKDIVVGPCGAGAVTFASLSLTTTFTDPDDPTAPPVTGHPNVGSPVTLVAEATDPGVACGFSTPSVKFAWTLAGPSGSIAVAFATSSGTQFNFTPDVAGTYDVSVRAVDARFQSAQASASVSTTACGEDPIALQPLVANFPVPGVASVNSYQPLVVTATPASTSCPARFAPQIAWSVAGIGAPAQLSRSFGPDVKLQGSGASKQVITAVAVNKSGQEGAPASILVEVLDCGSHAPVITTVGNSPAFPARMQTITLTAGAADPDAEPSCNAGRAWSPTFELLSAPQGSGFTFQPGFATFVAQVEGTYAFRVVATENGTGLRSEAAVLNVTVLDPDPAASTVVATPATVVVGGPTDLAAAGATVTVTVRNRLGQPIGDLPVSVAASGSGNTFRTPASVVTNRDTGVFVTTMSSTKAEPKTFTATANPGTAQVVLNDHPSVTFVAGPTASISLTGLPGSVTAGVASTVTVTAFDTFANVAEGPNAYIGTVHFSSTDPHPATLPPDFTFAPTDHGRNIFIDPVRLFTAGSRTVTVKDTLKPALSDSQTVVVSPAAPDTVAFTVQPSLTTAGVTISPAVETTVKDAFANLVPNASVTLSIKSGPVGGTLLGPKTLPTNASGVASFANLSIQKSGTYTLHAAVTGTPGADSDSFDIAPAAPATAVFTVQPTPTVAGIAISPAVEVTVKDAFANGVPTVSVIVSIGTGPIGAVLLGATTEITNASGIAGFADLKIQKAGSYKLHAAVAGTPGDDSAAFDINPGPAATLTLTVLPDPFPAGTSQPFTVTLFDAFANIATGYTGTVDFTSSDPQALFIPNPPSHTFTGLGGDKGVFVAHVTLVNAGPQSITAKDSLNVTLTASQDTTVSGLLFAKQAAGNALTQGTAVTSFGDGSFAVTGSVSGNATFGPHEAKERLITAAGVPDFFLARYDSNGLLAWVKSVGATGSAVKGTGVAARSADGSAVAVGTLVGGPATFGAGQTLTATGGQDLFIVRYDSTGSVAWAKQAGGTGTAIVSPFAVARHPDGASVVTGSFSGTATWDATPLTSTAENFFVARYKQDGTLDWVKAVSPAPASGFVRGLGVAATSDGGAIATGSFNTSAGFGGTTLTTTGTSLFVVRYTSTGTVAWAHSATSAAGTVNGQAIATFSDDSSVVSGDFSGNVTFAAGPGGTLTALGSRDALVARYEANGTFTWGAQAGGAAATALGFGIAAYADGTSAVVGPFVGSVSFGTNTAGPVAFTSSGSADVFIARYAQNGAIVSAKPGGGTGDDRAFAVAGFPDNGAVVTGFVSGPEAVFGGDVPAQATKLSTGAGAEDMFVAKYYPYPF